MNKELSTDSRINYDKIESEKKLTSAYIAGYKGEKLDQNSSEECKQAFESGAMDRDFNNKMKDS